MTTRRDWIGSPSGKYALFAVAALLSRPVACLADFLVLPDRTGPYPTIQAALDAAPSGGVILLADGVFQGAGNRNLSFHEKALTIRSISGSSASCVIDCYPQLPPLDDCPSDSRGFHASGSAAMPSRFEGFTIRRAISYPIDVSCKSHLGTAIRMDGHDVIVADVTFEENGAAISLSNSTATIEDCVISGNKSGINAWNSSLRVTGTLISQNVSLESWDSGGGITAFGTDAIFERCRIVGNGKEYEENYLGSHNGGAAFLSLGTSISFLECAITGNSTQGGGGAVFLAGAGDHATIVQSTIAGNRANRGGGFGGGGVTELRNTILWGNCASLEGDDAYLAAGAAATFDCSVLDPSRFAGPGSADWSATNVFEDPLFCSPAACTLAPTIRGLYIVYVSSPAYDHPKCGRIGQLAPGCLVSLTNDSWGRIKSRYR